MLFVLTGLSATEQAATRVRDPFLGFSFVEPPGWVVQFPDSLIGGRDNVRIYDPKDQATYAGVLAFAGHTGDLDAYFRSRMDEWKRSQPNWTARPESIRRFQVSGQEAQSLIADYTEDGRPKVEFVAWVPSANIRLAIYAYGIEPENLDAFLKRFQLIVDSLIVPPGGNPTPDRVLYEASAPNPVRDPLLGFSFVAPPRWVVQLPDSLSGGWDFVRLYDPEGQAAYVSVLAIASEPGDLDAYLRSRSESWRQHTEARKQNWTVRPESVRRLQVGGQEAQSLIADYTEAGQPKVEFVTWVPSANIRLAIRAYGIDPQNLDAFLKRFQPIVDSLKVP
jgi:hypothetical protein